MNTLDNEKSTVTKRDLATRVRLALQPDIKLHQAQVAEVISKTLDTIRDALVDGSTVELQHDAERERTRFLEVVNRLL